MDKLEQLWRVKRVEKSRDIDRVNDLIQKGWKILAIEQRTEMQGYKETHTYFVLGHVDENADTE